LPCGAPLPSYHDLATELGVAMMTAKRGIDALVAEGVVRRQKGQGCFVNKELSRAPRELEHVGVIYPSSRESMYALPYVIEIMRGIAQKAPPQADTHLFSLRQDGLVRAAQLGEWKISGVILLEMGNDDYLRAFAQWGTPGVVVDYCSQDAPLDYVACDNRAAARQMVTHLAALGHRRVVYVAAPSPRVVARPDNEEIPLMVRESSDTRERRDESVNALRERDMLADVINISQDDQWTGCLPDEMYRQICSGNGPTAVLTESNYAVSLLLDDFARHGLRVPADVSVCALASDSDTSSDGRRLTGCRFDFVGMGCKAIDLLSARCLEPVLDKPCVHRIGFKFMEGEMTKRVGANQGA